MQSTLLSLFLVVSSNGALVSATPMATGLTIETCNSELDKAPNTYAEHGSTFAFAACRPDGWSIDQTYRLEANLHGEGYVLDTGISGDDCIAELNGEPVSIDVGGGFLLSLAGAVLSCIPE